MLLQTVHSLVCVSVNQMHSSRIERRSDVDSDCATNFVGATKVLAHNGPVESKIDKGSVEALSIDEWKRHLIPYCSPSFGTVGKSL